jgi:hypothetical protein
LTALAAGLAYWGVDAEGRFRREQQRVAQAGKDALEAAINHEAMRPDIEGVLTVFALEPVQNDDSNQRGSLMSQSLLKIASDRDIPIEKAIWLARDEVLRVAAEPIRPFIVTDLNAPIYLRRHPPERKRYALVIGNNDYQHLAPLMWPTYDAESGDTWCAVGPEFVDL